MSSTQSVLDSMTAGILDRKAGKTASAGLTPVAGERAPAPPTIPHDLPGNFMAAEGIRDAAKDLRAHAALLLSVADSLDLLTGMPTVQQVDPTVLVEEARKRAEREADARVAAANAARATTTTNDFAVQFAEKQEAAQRAVFSPDADKPPVSGSAAAGWACPVHGPSATQEKTSRKGRTYRVCSRCLEFEK